VPGFGERGQVLAFILDGLVDLGLGEPVQAVELLAQFRLGGRLLSAIAARA